MKIIDKDCVYVQKKDLLFLYKMTFFVPSSIFIKIFKNSFKIDDNTKNDFIKIDEPEQIEFIKKIDWVIDYNEIKDKSLEEVLNLCQNVALERNELASRFDFVSEEECEYIDNQCEILDYKIYSLREILWFKQGHVHINLPQGIDYPESYKKNQNGVKKLIKSLFKKNNN